MKTAVLQISELTKNYKGELGQKDYLALENLSLNINPGEVFAFLGPNGAGKSTTIKLIARLLHPTHGDILIDGKSNKDPDAMKHLGYVPEQPSLYGYLTGREFLQYMGRLCGKGPRINGERIKQLIDMVGLAHRADHAIRGYSRGMVQRLALAQALVHDPSLLILDEPMANLDPVGRKDFRDLILNLKNQGKTIFFSSHILNDAEIIADRVGILNKGKLVKISSMQDLLKEQNVTIEITFQAQPLSVERLKLTDSICAQQGSDYMIQTTKDKIQSLIGNLNKENVDIISIIPQRATLEDIFMEEIGGNA